MVYEFGAGTGQLACDIIQTAGDLITQYNIVDVSTGLRNVQLAKLKALHGPQVEQKVRWLEELPTELGGIVLGNEVLDATPVRRFKWQEGHPLEAWVQYLNGKLDWVWRPAEPVFAALVSRLQNIHGPWPEGYESEIAEQSIAWVKTVTERLNGLALMIDYGFHEAVYYHPTRRQGTLRATSRHTAHDDFLVNVGQQDLTAHVNFSAVYEALTSCGGELEGYTHQGEFLLAHGILDLARKQPEFTHPTRGALIRQNLNTLLNEADMGEAFKVICWSKRGQCREHSLGAGFLGQGPKRGSLNQLPVGPSQGLSSPFLFNSNTERTVSISVAFPRSSKKTRHRAQSLPN
ncbi:MAG: hypothetical protein BEV12_24080, partial [Microcystis aeruginosa CACIAM 03]